MTAWFYAQGLTQGGTKIPPAPSWPRWRLTRTGGGRDFPLGYIRRPSFQVEAWGSTDAGGDLAALALSEQLEAAILALPGVRSGAVVTASDVMVSARWMPDAQDNDRPRYITDFRLVLHG